MKRFILITPFLFTLAFVLHINYWVVIAVSPDQLFRLLFILWILLGLLIYPAYLLTRSWEWASLLLTIFVFGIYFSQTFFEVAGSIVLALVIIWLIYFRFRGYRIEFRQLFVLLNGIAVAIIVLSLYLNIQAFAQVPWPTYFRSVNESRHYFIEGLQPPAAKPDIYYIVLDGYPRSDILKTLYNYDNTEFTTYLQGRGFIVPADVHSNYGKTAVSIPSTLNMDYLESFSPGLEKSRFWWLMVPFIQYGRVRAILESQGYKAVNLTTWNLTSGLTNDARLRPYAIMLTDYERYILGDTPLGFIQPLLKNIASIPTFDNHRSLITHFIKAMKVIPQIQGPKFVFAHLTAPHPPFVFDGKGNPIDPPGHFNLDDAEDFYGSDREYRDGYVGQVEYVNNQLELVLDSVIEQSETPPIIILQADHGSGMLTDFASVENTCIKERYSPFAAYYLPGMDQNVIPGDVTPVNLFRIILNQYFQADLPLLENRHYYNPYEIYFYRLTDVTSRVDEECAIP